MTHLCSFCGWVIFHCVCIAHLLYPFLCWQTFMLLPRPACCKWCCNKHLGYSAQLDTAHLWPTFWVTRGYSVSWRGFSNIIVQSNHVGSESKIQIPGPSPSRSEAEPRWSWFWWAVCQLSYENKYLLSSAFYSFLLPLIHVSSVTVVCPVTSLSLIFLV